jgi:hypothetical protein
MSTSYLDKDGLTYLWSKIKNKFLRGNVGGLFYGTCPSVASAVTKAVTCGSFTADDLVAGTFIVVTFTNTNTGAVANLTMNVNSTGAKHIKYINNGTLGNLPSTGYLKANTEYPFYYDGANWVLLMNYNTTYTSMSETEMEAGTATSSRVITAARLKEAVEYHAPVTSVNGQTGAVTIAVPDAVSVTQKTTSGTNIADITIGGTTTKLYAPTGGGGGITVLDCYPVGSYYETSDSSFDPNTAWGGTWELETEGQVHVSAGSTYGVSGALSNTTDGGEKTHTLSVNEMPSHAHALYYYNTSGDKSFGYQYQNKGRQSTEATSGSGIVNTGGGQAHNNMQPYIVVNRWHRTA